MLAEQRRHQIMQLIERNGQVRTQQVSAEFGVSEVTIRSDFEFLERKGQLNRIHGGALVLAQNSSSAKFDERMRSNLEAKKRIAQAAAKLITDNQSVVFDSGSTLLQLAMHMPTFSNVIVSTTGMNIAQHLMNRDGLDVHMIGGRVFPNTDSTIISDINGASSGMIAHQVFVSAHAIDASFDIVDVNEDIARSKRSLVRMARRVILLVDSSKWEIEASSIAFPLSRVDMVVTDNLMPDRIKRRLNKLKIEVKYA